MRSSSSSTATSSTPKQTARSSAAAGSSSRQLTQWRELLRLLPRTDVFHFYFGLTLVPRSVQFPILRALRKKSVMHYLGSDIRGKTPQELAFGRKAGAEIVGSYDAIRWVPHAEFVPPGVDVASIEPSYPDPQRARPVILHAPSSRRRKGTEHVLAACEGLDADLVLVEGLDHREAFERYREADIVVDQLNAGWYGLFAIECMALGKPVVTFLHDEAVRRTQQELGVSVPLVNATKDTLRARLEPLVADAAERRRLGEPRAPTSSRCTTSNAWPTACSRSTLGSSPWPPSAPSSGGSGSTPRSTASAASSRASSRSSSCRSTRGTSRRPTTGRSRR